MTQENQADRLGKLEILFCEQEYTIETLNRIVTQQDKDIKLLSVQFDVIKQQLQELKKETPEKINSEHEKPPHY